MNHHLFEEARKLYPGTKRGHDVEYQNFRKKYRMKQDKIIPLLKPAIEAQIAFRESQRKKQEWTPGWKHFATWINGAWWTEEMPQSNKPKPRRCQFCGDPPSVHMQGKGWRCGAADCREKYNKL